MLGSEHLLRRKQIIFSTFFTTTPFTPPTPPTPAKMEVLYFRW